MADPNDPLRQLEALKQRIDTFGDKLAKAFNEMAKLDRKQLAELSLERRLLHAEQESVALKQRVAILEQRVSDLERSRAAGAI
jgi:hypothetical protein